MIRKLRSSILFYSLFLLSCSEYSLNVTSNKTEVLDANVNGIYYDEAKPLENSRPTILGVKKQDPYTVDNMRKALSVLLTDSSKLTTRSNNNMASADFLDLQANYLYVRFLTKNIEQEHLLKALDLELSSEPMDMELVSGGNFYVDESLPEGNKYYYAAVPVDYKLPSEIAYEVLKELFLIDDLIDEVEAELLAEKNKSNSDSLTSISRKFSSKSLANSKVINVAQKLSDKGFSLANLEAMSLLLTSNKTAADYGIVDVDMNSRGWFSDKWEEIKAAIKRKFSKQYYPSGKIFYKNSEGKVLPLENARVQICYFYKCWSHKTKKDGSFKSTHKFIYAVKYKVKFSSAGFYLENDDIFWKPDLYAYGPRTKKSWHKVLTGIEAKYAEVYSAVEDYHTKDIDGLRRPNKWMNVYVSKLKQKVWGNYKGLLNSVTIYLGSPAMKSSSIVYATTIHEIAHSIHFTATPYLKVDSSDTLPSASMPWLDFAINLKESWAMGVETYLTLKKYPTYRCYNFGAYTGIIMDLIDSDEFFQKLKNGDEISGDKVSGFRIAELEKAVFKSHTLSDLKQHLLKDYPSGKGGRSYSKSAMNELFDYWDK